MARADWAHSLSPSCPHGAQKTGTGLGQHSNKSCKTQPRESAQRETWPSKSNSAQSCRCSSSSCAWITLSRSFPQSWRSLSTADWTILVWIQVELHYEVELKHRGKKAASLTGAMEQIYLWESFIKVKNQADASEWHSKDCQAPVQSWGWGHHWPAQEWGTRHSRRVRNDTPGFKNLSPTHCRAGDEKVTGLKRTEPIPKSLFSSSFCCRVSFGWQARLAEALQ